MQDKMALCMPKVGLEAIVSNAVLRANVRIRSTSLGVHAHSTRYFYAMRI